MSTSEEKVVDYLRWVTADLQQTRQELAQERAARQEPIAIIGIGCRFPGDVRSPDDLWRVVRDGEHVIGDLPTDRGWDVANLYDPTPGTPGHTYVTKGGFLPDAAEFDNAFFDISPREATAMDPQQRLLLETTWEAFERAGVDPRGVSKPDVGVFVGAMNQDYGPRLHEANDGLGGFLLTGTAASVTSGRIAYVFGFEGPTLTVDTACSSSLVALHLAVRSLRRGECALAVSGGATVMTTPGLFIEFSQQQALARDGRCKSFSADADGTSWAEGVGVLLLERLSDAVANNHQVLAVIRGSAITQDGASNGLTAPNGLSQERVIGQALADAGLTPADVDVVEAHGTGTTLGDPIEAQALLDAYGSYRPADRPLWLGSLKSNIGHTQAASGVAGIIKMVQAMRHGLLPRTLHVDRPTPHVDWDSGAVALLTRERRWEPDGRPRRAAVSAFGISGTNAHVILEQAPAPQPPAGPAVPAGPAAPWVVSARTAPALRDQAAALARHVRERPDLSLADVGFALATTRAGLEHRAAVMATDRDGMLAGLQSLADGEPDGSVAQGVAGQPPRIVFVFPGQGSQWAGMAAGLLADSPEFAAAIDACEAALRKHVDWSLRDVLTGDGAALERVDVVQPALWAVMVALAALWRSYGIEPHAVVGHSQGEIAAAYVAGALSLDDSARIVALRARAIATITGSGGMASIALPLAEVTARLAGTGLHVAAINGPASVVVAGPADEIAALVDRCDAESVHARVVPVDYASHTPAMDVLRDRLLAELAPVRPQASAIPFYSSVTGALLDTRELDGGYWQRNLSSPVLFSDAVLAATESERTLFIEVSAHPVVTAPISDTLAEHGRGDAVGTLRREHGDLARFHAALGEAFVHGATPRWSRVFPHARAVDLPTYAFQRQHYWLPIAADGNVAAAGLQPAAHPLLGSAVDLPDGEGWLFTGKLSLDTAAWLADHAVQGTVLLPGTGFVDLALHAASHTDTPYLRELTIEAPLPLTTTAVLLQVKVGEADEDGDRPLAVYSRLSAEDDWTRHATGLITASSSPVQPSPQQQWPPTAATEVNLAGVYDDLAARGYCYGPAFQGLRRLWRDGDHTWAEIELPGEVPVTDYAIHPALLDAALHPMVTTMDGSGGTVQLPFAWTDLEIWQTGVRQLRVHLHAVAPDRVTIELADRAGDPVGRVGSLTVRGVDPAQLAAPGTDPLYRLGWVAVSAPPAADTLAGPVLELHNPAVGQARAALAGDQPPGTLVIDLQAGPGPVPAVTRELLASALDVLHTVLDDERLAGVDLVFRTDGAVAIADEPPSDLAAAAVWGLVRSAQAEHPGRITLVDIAGESDAATLDAETLVRRLVPGEPQLVRRGAVWFAPRLQPATPGTATKPFDPQGTVLITGGTGTLGALVARHLVGEHGARHLLLASRTGPGAEGAAALREELAALGAEVRIVACDVAEPVEVDRLLAMVPAEHPLTAVFHTAGALDDAVVTALTPAQLDTVLRPKVDAAWYLHQRTSALDVAAFVLFSSAAGVFGTPGQGNYAAANAFLDALAHQRHAAGLPATSLAWGLWATRSGMTGHLDEADHARLRRTGIRPMSDEEGLAMLDAAMALGQPDVTPVRLDLTGYRHDPESAPALLRALVRPRTRARSRESDLRQRLVGLDRAEQKRLVLSTVRAHIAAVLGQADPEAIEPTRTFKDLGFSSLAAVELRNRLNKAAGLRLPSTVVFDHPTLGALADHIHATIAPAEVDQSAKAIADLAQLESTLLQLPGDCTDRGAITERLQALLERWRAVTQPDTRSASPAATQLASASTDEIFAFIDQQLGRR